jgi:hypothetical protein
VSSARRSPHRLRRICPSSARWRAQLGDIDGAFRDLDTAVAERTIWIIYVTDFADLAPIRGDSRYAALLKRLGLPDGRSAK